MKKYTINILILCLISGFAYSWLFNNTVTPVLPKTSNNLELNQQLAWEVTKLGGGVFNEELQVIVPVQPSLVHAEWLRNKEIISKKIGRIFPLESSETARWKNSAKTIDELISDAKLAAPSFLENSAYISLKTDTKLSFGPNNAHMFKSLKSLKRKVRLDARAIGISNEMAVARVGDALRGTLIVHTPAQIGFVSEEIRAYALRVGGKVFFRNYWEEERLDGYVAVHARLLLPVQDRWVMAELQIHLDTIMDGTSYSVKQREHDLYVRGLLGTFDPIVISGASKLLYLVGMRNSELILEQGPIESAVKYYYTVEVQ